MRQFGWITLGRIWCNLFHAPVGEDQGGRPSIHLGRTSLATETATITEKYVDLSHGKTRYYEAGVGYPLILIHGAGFLSGADTWLGVMHPLAERHRVLAVDCLNWGFGDVFDQELSFAYLVDHIREFMDVLGIEKANVAGHSMGGWIATLLAYESPDRLNQVILSSACGTATRPLQ